MKPTEQGYLLLTSRMGDQHRAVLTVAQLRKLAIAVTSAERPRQDSVLQQADLVALGYSHPEAQRITDLLQQEQRLKHYLFKARQNQCLPITRVTQGYPLLLRQKLGLDSPGVLWAKGERSLLNQPAIALVGSRELAAENAAFAAEVGRQAALQGYVLVSGNARGADRMAQESCLAAGGQVISIVADSLQEQPVRENILYLSEDSFDLPFSAHRALSRNRLIHAMAGVSIVAQCSLEKGGTWSGSVDNLRHSYSRLCVFSDGSSGAQALIDRGGCSVTLQALSDISALHTEDQKRINL